MRTLGMMGLAALLGLAACGKKDPGAGGAGTSGGGGGSVSATCQTFLDNYGACIKALPEAGRGAAEKTLTQMKEGWSGIPADALEKVCKQALDQAKQTMGSMCPDVKWQ